MASGPAPTIPTELVTPDNPKLYCDVSDVERFIRGESFTTDTDPSDTEVEEFIEEVSADIDGYTNRAWRPRRCADWIEDVSFSHQQKSSNPIVRRGGGTRARRHSRLTPGRSNPWGVAFLPHPDIKEFDSAQGDVLKALLPRDEADIIADSGRDSAWFLEPRNGQLKVNLSAFSLPLSYRNPAGLEHAQVEVSYRYGRDQVPSDIKRAAAKLVASELAQTDQFSVTVVDSNDSGPDANTTAKDHREEAHDILNRYVWHGYK